MALVIPAVFARENVGTSAVKFRKATVQEYTHIDVNQISAWVTNYGSLFRHPITGDSGFEYPAGSGTFAIYATGLWVGARVNGSPRVVIAEYSYEYKPGKIINGVPDDPDDSRYQLYKWLGSDTPDASAVADGAPETLIGDQYLWSVYNDGDASYHTAIQTDPLMIEVQQSVFGFARTGPLGNTVFVKWLVVNKSGTQLEDTYITVWCDPDVGGSGDDLVGCDSTLSLGYCYNGDNNDTDYGEGPPATGIDFFQGPIVLGEATDTASVSGVKFPGYKNLPMTSFVYYNNNNQNNGNPQTGPEVYNYMQSRWRDGTPITRGGNGTLSGNPPARFMYTGEPAEGTGWLDSSPADRRFMMTTGPFTMEPFVDTNGNGKEDIGEPGVQEIVVGVMVARGADNLASVSLLKQYDELAQLAYDLNFDLAVPPPPPTVEVTLMDQALVLNWANQNSTAGATYEEVENYDAVDPLVAIEDPNNPPDTTYTFQGYLVYQYDYLDKRNAKLIGNIDVADGIVEMRDFVLDEGSGEYLEKLVWKGTDSGMRRNMTITEDRFSDAALPTLINGKRYWFGVVAWGYNEDSSPKAIYSPLIPNVNFWEVVPQSPRIGTHYDKNLFGNMIQSEKIGTSDGAAFAEVVDPTKITGHDYKVEFEFDAENEAFWNLVDESAGETVLTGQYHQAGDSADVAGPIADGVRWQIMGPAAGFHGAYLIHDGTNYYPERHDNIDYSVLMEDVWNYGYDNNMEGITFPDGGRYWLTQGGGVAADNASYTERVLRGDNWNRAKAFDFELRFVADSAWALWGWPEDGFPSLVMKVPFEIWNVGINTPEDPSDDFQMIPRIYDLDEDGRLSWQGDLEESGAADDPGTDWIYWFNPADVSSGTGGYDAFAAVAAVDGDPYAAGTVGDEVLARVVFMNHNGFGGRADSVSLAQLSGPLPSDWTAADTALFKSRNWFIDPDNNLGVVESDSSSWAYGFVLPFPPAGSIYRWVTNKPNAPGDEYKFSAPGSPTVDSQELAKKEIDLINVFPNPYYGTHSGERDPLNKWVEFTHLPQTCTIRIFNLAGALVRTIKREGVTDRTWEKWDLENQSALPIASGIYIYHIEVPGIGEKVGKLAVFMQQERLDTF